MDGHSPSKIYQKELYYKLEIWHLDLTHKIKTGWQLLWMVSHHHQNGNPPSKGWVPTIQNLMKGSVLQTWNLAHRRNQKIKTSWQLPLMVGYHPLDGHPPSQGWSLTTENLPEGSLLQNLAHRLNNKIKTRWQPPWMVSYHPLDGHPPSQEQGRLPIIPRMVTYQP